ncbi:MAG: hypothetical protein ACOCYQ_02505 [Alkalispirochaeta sp.]
MRRGTAMLLTVICTGCGSPTSLPEMIEGDWVPPMLGGITARSPEVIALEFDEPVRLLEATIEPPVLVADARWHDDALEIRGSDRFEASTEYWVDARVEDKAGNISSVLASVYGLNENLPRLRISEVVCEGSAAHPDWVELEVLEGGDLAGVCLYEGSPSVWDSRKVFPSVSVSTGEFVVVHFKPEVIPEEVDEISDPAESGGLDVHPEAWDFWVSGGDGIPNTTGGLTLTSFPGGPVIDAFLYTTKRYDPNDDILGFGLKSQLEIFEEIVEIGGWKPAGEFVIPEDGVDPEDSTATRSICRDPGAPDTDTAADWHITPTSGATPGYENTTERYEP